MTTFLKGHIYTAFSTISMCIWQTKHLWKYIPKTFSMGQDQHIFCIRHVDPRTAKLVFVNTLITQHYCCIHSCTSGAETKC